MVGLDDINRRRKKKDGLYGTHHGMSRYLLGAPLVILCFWLEGVLGLARFCVFLAD